MNSEQIIIDEETIMGLIIASGSAKSFAMEALAKARNGEFDAAEELLGEAKEALNEAHLVQTKLIESDAGEGKVKASLVLVHAQDHLMTSILCHDMAKEMIEMYKQITNGKY
ncbi:PTS lactose/cellobiose transporter subunit IIA [Vibrio parahaemolyticus]|nr:PTS lactose/cellobiose transporter subunit IIA [Vibrio parahaemolyticus]